MTVRRVYLTLVLCLSLVAFTASQRKDSAVSTPVRLVIAGLVHPHVVGVLQDLQRRTDIRLVGVFEPDAALRIDYAEHYNLPASLFFTDLPAMLEQVRPDVVATFTDTFDHKAVVEAAALRHTAVMVEKPLAVSMDHALAIQRAAAQGKIPVMVNYSTSWYPGNAMLWRMVEQEHALGEIRKMAALIGHSGPKPPDTRPEALAWLTDPLKAGGGALFDFGCYGANLMTWLMHNQRPTTVTAVTQQNQPDIYQHVEDEATIILQYPKAQGVIQASWNWPFNRKELEVYGNRGYVMVKGDRMRVRLADDQQERSSVADPLPPNEGDPLTYLIAVARHQHEPEGRSSLENNMIVTEILEAARDSARAGKTIVLP